MLYSLLKKIEDQKTEGKFTFSIAVVDNDLEQSARTAVEAFRKESRCKIIYSVEAERNIAMARNEAVNQADGTYIAFIDDDELPENDWLLRLLSTCQAYKADGVLAPVLPYFDTPPPKWVIKGKLFERKSHTTGYKLGWKNTRTGNVLLHRAIFEKRENRFDPVFGSGGEDRDFFRRMIAKGYHFIWCQYAPVHETISPNRWNRSFLIRRALLRGQVSLLHPTRKMVIVAKSMGAVVLYTLMLPLLALAGHHFFMKYLIKLGDHVGRLLAAAGIRVIKETYVTQSHKRVI